jgi:hypothetical protein
MSRRARVRSRGLKSKKGSFASKAVQPDLYSTKSKSSPADQVLNLQRTAGNQAVQRLFEAGVVQPKLKIGQPGDKYELEADRMAEQVMRMSDSFCPSCVQEGMVQRQPMEEEEKKKEEELIQPKSLLSQITPLVQRQVEDTEKKKREEEIFQAKVDRGGIKTTANIETSVSSLKGIGEPLSEATRSYFEPRFGYDFSAVRIHTGSEANEAAKSIDARAFTIGNDVVFGSGSYSPKTDGGKKLIAHELVHTIQQGAVTPFSTPGFLEGRVQPNRTCSAIQREPVPGTEVEEKSEELGTIERLKLTLQCILENDELRNKLVDRLIESCIPEEWRIVFEHIKKNEKLRKYLYEKAKETFLPESVKRIVDILESNPLLRKLIIQKLIEQLPWDQFLIFLEKCILSPFISVENLSEKTKNFFFKHFSNITLAILLNEFRTGTGKKERVFDISHAVTKEVAESSAVKEAFKVFYQENASITQFENLKPLVEYEYKFSPKGDEPYYNIPKSAVEHMKGFYKVASEWNWVDLFMGGVFVSIVPGENNMLNIEVRNEIGKESLMLHAVPDLPETEGEVPYRTTVQRFVFSVPYDSEYLKKHSACYQLYKSGKCL